MNSNARKIIFFISLLAMIYFTYTRLVKPANANLIQRRQQINAKLQKLDELNHASAKAENLNKQLSQLTEAVDFFCSKLPHESEIHNVLEQITLIAQKHNLQSGTISTLKPKDYNGYIEQPLKMQMQGDFYSFYSFLLEVEKLPRIIRLREFDIKKDDKKASQIYADFIVSVFFST